MTLSQDFVSPPTPARNGHDKSNGHDRPERVVLRARWDRPPQPALAKRVGAARRRRAKALAEGRNLFNYRTLSVERTEARLRKAHALYEQYRSAGSLILELELLD